ncbi:hypothetical protein A2U01_0086406 [Trifolium medium]|uniref:Uncharacterized protein n=1 Tax=Trifolium medium TaxID=97028 RepID=A0A392TW79_9FABA|nr:hypothetical protein [Trifolium medium]
MAIEFTRLVGDKVAAAFSVGSGLIRLSGAFRFVVERFDVWVCMSFMANDCCCLVFIVG